MHETAKSVCILNNRGGIMYGLIISLCFIIFGLDVCLMVSKKTFTTDSERELADQEQMEYLKKLNRKSKYR